MNYTTNYQLPTWVETDRIQMDDFNDMTDKLDAALGEQQAALVKCGNCKAEIFSYTGTGSTTSRIDFPERPVFFIIQGGTGVILGGPGKTATLAASGASVSSSRVDKITMTWSGSQLSLTDSSAYMNLNVSNVVYQVIAFYLMDAEQA